MKCCRFELLAVATATKAVQKAVCRARVLLLTRNLTVSNDVFLPPSKRSTRDFTFFPSIQLFMILFCQTLSDDFDTNDSLRDNLPIWTVSPS